MVFSNSLISVLETVLTLCGIPHARGNLGDSPAPQAVLTWPGDRQGWSMLSFGATKVAKSATDATIKMSASASEKLSEMSQTVTEKVGAGQGG